MRTVLQRIFADLRSYWFIFPLFGAYWLVMHLVTGGGICPLPALFGIPCPGCGMTRALMLVLRGRLLQAFWMHPMIYPVLAMALYYAVYRYLLGRRAPHWDALLGLTVAALLVCYVLRMVLLYPDAAPMTYQARNLLALVLRYLGGSWT